MSVKTDIGPFAIIPLWLLEIANENSIRLYAWLWAKYSDTKTHESWPAIKTLANDLNWSESTVKKAISDLKNIGAIIVENRFREDGSSLSNMYTLITIKPQN